MIGFLKALAGLFGGAGGPPAGRAPSDEECPTDDLVEALRILAPVIGAGYPTTCEDELLIVHADPSEVSEEDKGRLAVLGFDADGGRFVSIRFGSRGY